MDRRDFPHWRLRYLLYVQGHRIAYVLLGLGCFLALAWSAVLYERLGNTNTRQDRTDRRIQEGRRQSIELLCDQNRIMLRFIIAKPDYPRDAPAIHDLRAERCAALLREVPDEIAP